MADIKRKSIAKLCLALGLFILAGVFRQLDRLAAPLPSAVCFLLTNLIYIGLAMAWGFSISRRILHCDDRRWLLLGCAMTVLWLFLRTVKYRFFSGDTITRYLWYLYYVPQILAPLFSLFAALQLVRREGAAFSRRWYLLFIPAALLIGGILSNDLHQMAFRSVPGAATLQADYTHGWMYYLAMTWIVGLLLATGIIVYRKCRISESRRYAWVPLCAFLSGIVLCALSFANTYTFHKMPECFCLTFAAFWESCLQVGLIPTNGYYRYFFSESTVAAQIEEKNRLMDEMIALVQPQLLQINRLLEEENAQALNVQNLKQVCLLGAYVKRRVNLALICDQKTVVPVDELAHCIRESLTYLTQYGAVCALHQEGKGSVSSRDVQTAYDFFEDCLEAALPSLSALMVRVECGERFSVRLMMEDAAGLPKADKYRALGKLTIDDADGALCATLSPDWGGVRA